MTRIFSKSSGTNLQVLHFDHPDKEAFQNIVELELSLKVMYTHKSSMPKIAPCYRVISSNCNDSLKTLGTIKKT